MLQVAQGQVKQSFSFKPAYEGKVVYWTPQQAVLHHNPPRAASVRATTDWILARAEKVGAYQEIERRRSTLRGYVVSIYHAEPYFYTKDELECRVRLRMIKSYLNCDVVLGIGSPRKVWTIARGTLVSASNQCVLLKLKYLRHTNKHVLRQPKEPAEHYLNTHKIQQVMLFREYK